MENRNQIIKEVADIVIEKILNKMQEVDDKSEGDTVYANPRYAANIMEHNGTKQECEHIYTQLASRILRDKVVICKFCGDELTVELEFRNPDGTTTTTGATGA